MPEYKGQILKKKMICNRPDLLNKWIERNEGRWFRFKSEIIGQAKDPKTAEQLGYYWGLLVPEICEQLQRDGYTYTIKFQRIEAEIPYNEEVTHNFLTVLCGHVGHDGEHLRLSDCDKFQTVKFIDNVLNLAGGLNMNMDELKARRPAA